MGSLNLIAKASSSSGTVSETGPVGQLRVQVIDTGTAGRKIMFRSSCIPSGMQKPAPPFPISEMPITPPFEVARLYRMWRPPVLYLHTSCVDSCRDFQNESSFAPNGGESTCMQRGGLVSMSRSSGEGWSGQVAACRDRH
jgi:hypothetical protein